MGDRLHTINDELRGLSQKTSPWLPLESNPSIFNSFIHGLGVPAVWAFHDVLGIDDELLALIPQPVAAAILLFPCSQNIYKFRRDEACALSGVAPSAAARATFHVEQHAAFGNACGTIAAIHAIANSRWAFHQGGASFESFVRSNEHASSAERGRALLRDGAFKSQSDSAAENPVAQTACPARDGPSLDHHYTAFVLNAGRLLEVDGTKAQPVDHGNSGPATFLIDVARVVRTNFMAVEPGSLEFSLMALCHTP
jgi:ubiquitin carboxyl-terminal hydrolase L3